MPLRTCIGCGRVGEKKEFVRFVSSNSVLALDARGLGRGAYLCPSEKCALSACSKKEAFSRTLKTKVTFAGAGELLKLMRASGALK